MKKWILMVVSAGAVIVNASAFQVGPIQIGGLIGDAGDLALNTVQHGVDQAGTIVNSAVELPGNVLQMPKNINVAVKGVKADTDSVKSSLGTLDKTVGTVATTIPRLQDDVHGLRSDFSDFLKKLFVPVSALIWAIVLFVAIKTINQLFRKPAALVAAKNQNA